MMTMGNALARGDVMPAMLAVWIPNMVGLIAGFILMRRASR
jgi:lipopolysaccharide export system permease protein